MLEVIEKDGGLRELFPHGGEDHALAGPGGDEDSVHAGTEPVQDVLA